MLSRYKIYRGKRPPEDPLPSGIRQDTRKHTRHCLRPTPELVSAMLEEPGEQTWRRFRKSYLAELEERFSQDPTPFTALAKLAARQDVYLGCNCPTARNPSLTHCHTVSALEFMMAKFPRLKVVIPKR